MTNPLKPALIGDSNPSRFNWLKQLLEQEFGLEVFQAKTFDEVKSRIGADTSGVSRWLIIIADDLRLYSNRLATPEVLQTYFNFLSELDTRFELVTVLIATSEKRFSFRITEPTCTIQISDPPTEDEYQACAQALVRDANLERLNTARITWDPKNRILRAQIRSLSERRNLSDGEEHLRRLIGRCLRLDPLQSIEVRPVGQGKSGASVFRLVTKTTDPKTKPHEYLLKLCQAASVWKIEAEVRGHLQAEPNLSHHGYLVHLPVLRPAIAPTSALGTLTEPNRYIVRSGNWYAVHFDFVGGDRFGRFVDLETAIVASTSELSERTESTQFDAKAGDPNTQRTRIFSTLLDWLCNNWYANLQSEHVERKLLQVWDSGDAPERKYVVMPPYKLTGRSKRWIEDFVDSHDAQLGARFFADWGRHSERVLRLISEDDAHPEQLGKLAQPLPLVLSHVHGDLNASNILLWLEKQHPFLIDFPFYQDAGHALQDLARLEVEIKLSLMDRQEDSSHDELKAYEHTYSQMDIWREMENHLLENWEQEKTVWEEDGYKENVEFCLTLVQLIRNKAKDVQQNTRCEGPPAGDFLDEYLPALLYHTVRSIGFPSLSVFKRLLAVYSAGLILERLGCFPDVGS